MLGVNSEIIAEIVSGLLVTVINDYFKLVIKQELCKI